MGLSISCFIKTATNIFSISNRSDYTNIVKTRTWTPNTNQEKRNQYDINSEHYNIIKKIGIGHYGVVYLCQNKNTDEFVAIKSIKITKNQKKYLINELKCLTILKDKHECIIKYIDSFQSRKNIYFVCEYIKNSCELYYEILNNKYFLESDAKIIMNKLLSCINTIHKFGIIHNDLKPENILISKKKGIFIIKLIDFGLSKYDHTYTETNKLKTYHTNDGTPYYIAPEVLNKKYTRTCDLWSCGVIMYILLCGYPPFNGQNNYEILEKIKTHDILFDNKIWENVSNEAICLIKHLLNRDSINRITAESALNHEWFNNIT